MTTYSSSRQKISQLNDELDRQLQKVSNNRAPSVTTKRDREQFRFIPKNDQHKKDIVINKPVVYDHNFRQIEKSKKNELGQLQRKLQQLERKMDNLSVSSEQQDKPMNIIKNQLNFKDKTQINVLNEDTARFLVSINSENRQKDKDRKQYRLPYPTLQNQEDQEEQEDSQDYFQIQKTIQQRKMEQVARNLKIKDKIHQVQTKRQRNSNQNKYPKAENTDRKIKMQVQSVLKPKYSKEKSNKSKKERVSNDKKSIRDSIVSKKSTQKVDKKMDRTNSKRSIEGATKSLRKSRQKNASRDRDYDNRSDKNEQSNFHSQEMEIIKDIKKMGNIEKQLVHYKRLAKKYKEQMDGYRIMEIEFKEMKKNFAKSQLIRAQQKKIIQNLKHRVGSK